MGLSTDVIALEDTELHEAFPEVNPAYRVQSRGIMPQHLSALNTILAGNALSAATSYELVHQASEEGPWLYRIPDSLVLVLANLPHDKIGAAALEWNKNPDLRATETGSLRELIEGLCAVARRGRSEGKRLYLWVCL